MWDDTDYTYGYSEGVLPDVSNSEAAQQPVTATGNGTGYYVDNGWLNLLGGTVQSALNYAIVRDQQQIAQKTGTVYAGVPLATTAAAATSAANSRILLLGLIAVGVAFAMKGK
jgi:orotate phosphoribosyltransferase